VGKRPRSLGGGRRFWVEQKLGGHRVCFGSMEKSDFLTVPNSLYSLLHSNGDLDLDLAQAQAQAQAQR
jgi:hypothetical protein